MCLQAAAVAAQGGDANAAVPACTTQPGVTLVVADGPGWSVRFDLQDYLQEYVFGEQLISYRLTFPPNAVRKEHLRLVAEANQSTLPYQLSDVTEANGLLQSATICFRTGLNKGEHKSFLLKCDPSYRLAFTGGAAVGDVDAMAHTAVLRANAQQVLVPYGQWEPNAPLSAVNAPILRVSREGGTWIGRGSFDGNEIVQQVRTSVVEPGPLRLRYRVEYTLAGGRQYAAVVTVQHNEAYITVDEYLTGIDGNDNLALRFSYRDGIDPDGRLAPGVNGNNFERSGRYDAKVADGLLPYALGLFGPNTACPRSTVFYNNADDANGSAIAFSMYRLKDWKTHIRYAWWMGATADEALYFHCDDDKYMTARLLGRERHWAMSILPRRQVAIESQDGSRRLYWYANNEMKGLKKTDQNNGGDPGIRLFQRLGAYSLDWVKDLIFEWDEDVNVVYDGHAEALTYEEFNHMGKAGNWWDGMFWWGGADWAWRHLPVERYQDDLCYGAKAPGRTHWQLIAAYAASRKNWTPQQRLLVRSWILHFVATYMFLDDNLPHYSMLAGHPNFLIESLYPGVFAAVFPNHPYNAQWKKTYLDILNEYLDVYVRKGNAEINALPGRHTENIACYSGASLQGVLHNAKGFQQWDGSNILTGGPFLDWMRWHMNALMTPGELGGWEFDNNEYTLTPPEGAHAAPTRRMLYDMGEYLEHNHEPLGAQLKWCLTKGKVGEKPPLKSALFYDWGPVLRYDFGGPHEAYLHMQQLGNSDPIEGYRMSGLNYRWAGGADGVLYYASRGRTWSWNRHEDCGDAFDIKGLSAFEVPGASLAWRKMTSTTRLLDLGGVQFYRSSEDANKPAASRGQQLLERIADRLEDMTTAYISRGVMMVRDRYIAIYDRVRDDKVQGVFRWVNRVTGVKAEYFDQPDFTQPAVTRIDDGRFPIQYNFYGTSAADKNGHAAWAKARLSNPDSFSARFTTRLLAKEGIDEAGFHWDKTTFTQQLGPQDKGRLWIDGNLVLDGNNGATGIITLQRGLEYDLRFEYVHAGGLARAILVRSDDANSRPRSIEGSGNTLVNREMPAIHAVREGPGNQLHLVESSTQPMIAAIVRPYGALVNEGNQPEYILMSDRTDEFHEGDMTFHGRTGYAQAGELYLFEGSRLSVGEFGIEVEGGDLGISAVLTEAGTIEGRFAGAAGGSVTLSVPRTFDPAGKELFVEGQAVAMSYDPAARTFKFDLAVALRDGYKSYVIRSKSK